MQVEISTLLNSWYENHQRPLPWRLTRDPYVIWVAEMILQQTRISQGLAYFYRFMDRFPYVWQLAHAPIEEVLLVWQGLGYYSRARNMHHTARVIVSEYKNRFPSSYNELIRLKGIGPYTAAAIASIAFNEPRALVDGNVHRVVSRFFGIPEAAGVNPAKSDVHRKAELILDRENPGKHNQAMMDLGAGICTPRRPLCTECPLRGLCYACKNEKVDRFPPVKRKPVRRNRYFYYMVLLQNGQIFIRQRVNRDIWEKLYEFPVIETARGLSPSVLVGTKDWKKLFGEQEVQVQEISRLFRHILTHQVVHARFFLISSRGGISLPGNDYLRIPTDFMEKYPFPALISGAMKELGWIEGKD